MLAKLAKEASASSTGYRRTGRRRLNKAGGSNSRTGKAFEDVVRADGVKGHMYNADDPDSIVWIPQGPGLGNRPEGGRPGDARAAVERQAAPARTSSSFLQELIEEMGRDPRKSRFRQL